ncbi:MAG: Ig-like domain-containing protein [Planctomycetota bacterium]
MLRRRYSNSNKARPRPARRFESLEPRYVLTGYFVDFSVLEPTDYTDTEVLVRFNNDVQVDALEQRAGVEMLGKDLAFLSGPLGEGFRADSQLWEIPVLPGQSVEDLVHYYNALNIVDYAEPNYRMQAAAVPNDQFYSVLWGMPNIGAELAWDTRTDSSAVIVGVIDSGVEYDHPDLADNIWTNSGEIDGNGIDDDGNGYVDDFYGYDFDNDDSDPRDDNGHGTHVAGTIGAKGNNSIGVAGVGWDASIMSLKVIGNGSNADVARAIDYATDNGAKITNNSYGYAGTNVGGSQAISNAIGRAKNAGVLYIVAAGNSRTNIPASDMDGNFNSWPAEYSKVHDNVITVAAIDSDGSFASYSHWGDESVQIAAPGTQIGSTYTNGGYVYSSGTSMAAPHVAGAAALLWAERPDLDYLGIKDAILSTARPDHLSLVGNGVLDLGAAMDLIAGGGSQNQSPNADNDSATVNEDESVAIAVLNNDSDPDGDSLSVDSFSQGSNGSVSNSGGILTYTPDANFNGSDSFTYMVGDGNGGTDTASVNVTVTPVNDNPVANNDSASTNEDVAVVINVVNNDTDIDGDSLIVSAVTNGSSGNVTDNGDGTVTYSPNPGFFGNDSFSYTISDGSATDTATVNVTVNEVTNPPNAEDDSLTLDEDTQGSVAVLDNDSDPDGDSLTIQSFTQGSNGAVAISGNDLVYTPNANFNGSDSFSYTINDGSGNTDSATVAVTVTPVNDNPVANDDSATTDQDVAVDINVLGNDSDVDGDSLTVASVANGSNGTVNNNGDGTVTYTPAPGFFGADSFTYTVSDGSASDTATVNVTVEEVTSGGDDAIGVSGTAIDVTHVWKTINLPISFDNPVVVAGGATRDGGHQGVVRVRNVTSDSFQIRFQEWDYRDGNHTTENIGYLVVEAGSYSLPDGTQLAAGTVNLTNESFQTFSFGTSFSSAPLVIGQVMTNNDSAAVVERIRNIGNSTFQMQFNEEEAADGVHATETVGFIAIDTGTATTGDVSLNAVKSNNSVTHQNTTINFGSIDGSSNPVILSDMQTRDGGDAATVRHRSQTATSVTVFVEEEASRDSELNHTTEVVGVLALEAGLLLGDSSSMLGAFSSNLGGSLDGDEGSLDLGMQFGNSELLSGLQPDSSLNQWIQENSQDRPAVHSAHEFFRQVVEGDGYEVFGPRWDDRVHIEIPELIITPIGLELNDVASLDAVDSFFEDAERELGGIETYFE